ncbi:hypothetical protein M2302_002464 [Micromonospora sp. A200]|nr:hypothetical protein [Micromonospora sp. A200]
MSPCRAFSVRGTIRLDAPVGGQCEDERWVAFG